MSKWISAGRQWLLNPPLMAGCLPLCVDVCLSWGLKGAKRPGVRKAHGSISPSLIEFLCAYVWDCSAGWHCHVLLSPLNISRSNGPFHRMAGWCHGPVFFPLIPALPAVQRPDRLIYFTFKSNRNTSSTGRGYMKRIMLLTSRTFY